jgi:hypothetical protein
VSDSFRVTEVKDTNGTLALVFAASVVVFLGPVGAVLAIVFAGRSRRELGYRSAPAWIGLIVGWLALACFAALALVIFLFSRSNLTF